MNIEFAILDFIRENLRTDFLDAVIPAVTALGNGGVFWIICALLMLIFPKTRKLGAAMGIALLIDGLLCNLILKPIVARPRPYEIRAAIELLIKAPSDYSFPSGHTGISFAGASAIFFGREWLSKKLRISLCVTAAVLAFLIALSRLYLYVHFPTDILGGMAVGILSGYIGFLLSRKFRKKMKY